MATPSRIIDGKSIANDIKKEIKQEVIALKEKHGKTPCLALLLIGTSPDSSSYIRMKKKACEQCGITPLNYEFPEDVTQSELLERISQLNAEESVHGILVQLPLPSHIDEDCVLDSVSREKDVDGLHPMNVASLCTTSTQEGVTKKVDWTDFKGIPFHVACTPQGCMELLDRSGVELRGKRAVVLGRSNLVGLPTAMLLMHRDATVTIVHSKTVNPASVVKEADVVIAAVGCPELIRADWLKPGCVVIDVGNTYLDDPNEKKGYRVVGDVDYEASKEVASLITPVPGGVGPMTIAMLLRNTVNSCLRTNK